MNVRGFDLNIDVEVAWPLQKWLGKKRDQIVCHNLLVVMGMTVLNFVVLTITAGFLYLSFLFSYFSAAALLSLFNLHIPPPFHGFIIPALTIIALCILYFEYFRHGDSDYSELPPHITYMSNPANPMLWVAVAKMVLDLFFTNPKITAAILYRLTKCYRLSRIDINECAKVLYVLANSDSALAFRQICENVKDLNPIKTFPQLMDIDGVLLLTGTGKLTLLNDLRQEIRNNMGAGHEGSGRKPIFDEADSLSYGNIDPELRGSYQILGINKPVTDSELKKIYRKLIRENHPDLFSSIEKEEIKKLAEERTKRLNEAYRIVSMSINRKDAN